MESGTPTREEAILEAIRTSTIPPKMQNIAINYIHQIPGWSRGELGRPSSGNPGQDLKDAVGLIYHVASLGRHFWNYIQDSIWKPVCTPAPQQDCTRKGCERKGVSFCNVYLCPVMFDIELNQ